MKNIKEEILAVVKQYNGIKSVPLVLKVSERIYPEEFTTKGFHDVVDELVNTGELIEIEYTDIGNRDRVKSIYFTSTTKFINK